jgi:hypothetical protein
LYSGGKDRDFRLSIVHFKNSISVSQMCQLPG